MGTQGAACSYSSSPLALIPPSDSPSACAGDDPPCAIAGSSSFRPGIGTAPTLDAQMMGRFSAAATCTRPPHRRSDLGKSAARRLKASGRRQRELCAQDGECPPRANPLAEIHGAQRGGVHGGFLPLGGRFARASGRDGVPLVPPAPTSRSAAQTYSDPEANKPFCRVFEETESRHTMTCGKHFYLDFVMSTLLPR